MVILPTKRYATLDGYLMAELMVAIAILLGVMLPVAYSFAAEKRVARAYYTRAVAMEIVDGEMETLVAGDWRSYNPGSQTYPVKANAQTNLPPGKFILTIQANKVRLEWQPSVKDHGGPVVREATVR